MARLKVHKAQALITVVGNFANQAGQTLALEGTWRSQPSTSYSNPKLLSQEITETQSITRNNIDTSDIDSLDPVVEKVLLETAMTEDELVEAFCGDL